MLQPATLSKNRLWHWCFPIDSAKLLRNLFYRTLLVAAFAFSSFEKKEALSTRYCYHFLIILWNNKSHLGTVNMIFLSLPYLKKDNCIAEWTCCVYLYATYSSCVIIPYTYICISRGLYIKVGLSPSKQIVASMKAFQKLMKNNVLFILKAFFVLKIFKFLSCLSLSLCLLLFLYLSLISKFMSSQPG